MENLLSTSLHSNIKQFAVESKQYLHCRDESSFNSVLRLLQAMGQASDLFGLELDTVNPLIQEFYVHLFELMNNIKDDSDLIWATVNVLQAHVKQGFFHKSKPNKYKFMLVLTKLLKDQLSLDRKIKILKLLQELTYGVKLQWQESYLSELIILLVKWISCEDKDLISLSLGVLVNVCSKNKFALFTLVKYTQSKSFMRLLLKLQSDDVFIKIQVYKLLLVIEQISGQVPNVDVTNLINVTFIVLEEGLKLKNVFILRHAVDFFIDISEHFLWKKSVLEYSDYKSKILGLLEAINNSKDFTRSHNKHDITSLCIEMVLKFVNHVVQMKNEDFIVLYSTIIPHTLSWAHSSDNFQPAMSILQTIVINVRICNRNMDDNLRDEIHSELEKSLNILLMFLKESCNVENKSNTCLWDRNAVCLKLLQEMLKLRDFYEKNEEKFCHSIFQSIFQSLFSVDIKNINNMQNITRVYLEALCCLSDLVAKNPSWMCLYSEVLNQKQVYHVLAFIIYNEPKHMKQKVLDHTTKFSQQSIVMLSDSLEEIKLLSSSKLKKDANINCTETEVKPLCSFTQEEQLQAFIDKLEEKFNFNEIQNTKTSDVLQLYQHKISLQKQTEVWLKRSLDNASVEISQSNYRIDSLNCESMRLNHLLLENHLAIDELTLENNQLKKKFDGISEKLSETSNNFAQLSQNYESKCQIIRERDNSIINLEKQLEELRLASNQMKTDLLDQLQNKQNEHKMQVSKLEQELIDKQNIISEKTEDIGSKISFIKSLENLLTEKDKENIDLRKELEEQHRVRAMISQMLASTGSNKPQ